MAKKKAKKKVSFRQRLRAESQERLEKIAVDVSEAALAAVRSHNTEINPLLVMQLLCSQQTKTLRENLITELSNEKELELEAIYNTQLGLDMGDTHVSET